MSEPIKDQKRVVQTFSISFEPAGTGGSEQQNARSERGGRGTPGGEQRISSEQIDAGALRVAGRHGV